MNRKALVRVAAPLAALLTATSCSLVGGGGGGEGTKLTAYFPRAISLFPQSAVKVMGLSAGKVTKVEVIGREVKVELRIDDEVPVPADARALLVPQSLIGERYVQLYPAFKEGDQRIKSGTVIPREKTAVPVEPDEALAALKDFIDALDPNATGRLVQNLAKDLKGQGPVLNSALENLARLTSTVAEKDDELARILDNFDEFAATMRTREVQLGRVMDSFAQLTGLLAQERREIESLVKSLGQLSSNALDLVSEHGTRLDRDLSVLTRTLQSVRANLDSVRLLLDAGPIMAHGLADDYDPKYQRLDLRNQFSPTVQQAVQQVLGPLGIPVGGTLCLPVDVQCKPTAPTTPAGPQLPVAPAPAASRPVTPTVPPAPVAPTVTAPPVTVPSQARPQSTTTSTTPIDSITGLLGGGRGPGTIAARPSTAERVASGLGGFGRMLRRAARVAVGAS